MDILTKSEVKALNRLWTHLNKTLVNANKNNVSVEDKNKIHSRMIEINTLWLRIHEARTLARHVHNDLHKIPGISSFLSGAQS